MPHDTAIDPLIAYRLRWLRGRARVLAQQEGELFDQLCRLRDQREATERLIRALDGPADTARHVVFVDGGSRGHPRQASAAYVVLDACGAVVVERAHLIGHASCNEAEWRAVILGLERALALGIRRLELRSDSQLVVGQLVGRHRVRSAKLKPLHRRAAALVCRFEDFRAVHVPRQENRRADALANAALTAAARAA